ncbi:arsenate-mycothiol transferase ArsC [Shinella zoogloeoides]|nr:low molecular weight phosphatase family protein [Shinella zoogloeoides]
MKKLHGRTAYVQSAGVKNDMEIDGFAVAVCNEIGVELVRHRSRSFEQMQEWGDHLGSFDLVVALSTASQEQALALAQTAYLEVEYWPIADPVGLSEGREATLHQYRIARDQIRTRIIERFGLPSDV